jgi:hypothetical protein
LEKRRYNEKWANITWENCTLSEYLNNEFYNKFSKSDMARIIEETNKNPDNQWYETKGGDDTRDKIFLSSLDEVVKYFGDSGDLKNRKGWNWEDGEFVSKDRKGYYINDQYNDKRGRVRWRSMLVVAPVTGQCCG